MQQKFPQVVAFVETDCDPDPKAKSVHPFLIHLMEKFELCFSFEEQPQKPAAKSRPVAV